MPPNTDANENLRVLLIEDDAVDVETVRRAFATNDSSIELHVARDGQEGLDMLRGGEVVRANLLILVDINMPRMSGIEFLRELRQSPDMVSLPVVVLTTSDDDRDKVEAYKLNAAGYILKPVTYGAFADILGTLESYWRLQEFPG